jgi:23S rRNA (guanosine2251-2'-O)-methyltransferase
MRCAVWPGREECVCASRTGRLDRLCGTPHHQGIAARRAAYTYFSEADLLDRLATLPEPALLLAADGLTDPMNLGNLCRSALAAGAHGSSSPGPGQAPPRWPSPALNTWPHRVTNLAETLRRLKDAGLAVIGMARGPNLYATDLAAPGLVIGSEQGCAPGAGQ